MFTDPRTQVRRIIADELSAFNGDKRITEYHEDVAIIIEERLHGCGLSASNPDNGSCVEAFYFVQDPNGEPVCTIEPMFDPERWIAQDNLDEAEFAVLRGDLPAGEYTIMKMRCCLPEEIQIETLPHPYKEED